MLAFLCSGRTICHGTCDCMSAGNRVTQEQLPRWQGTTIWLLSQNGHNER